MFKITSPEDQQKFILPLNRISEQIIRDQRFIVDANIDYDSGVHPTAWKVSKVHRLAPNGLTRVTMAEDRFNQFTDAPDYDNKGHICGFYADLFESTIFPAPEEKPLTPSQIINLPDVHAMITWSGTKPQLKVGGSFKTFTVNYYNKKNELIDTPDGNWIITVDNYELSKDDYTLINKSDDLASNQIKIKLADNTDLLNHNMRIQYVAYEATGELLVEIVSL